MKRRNDILIIGGGIAGMAYAMRLVTNGRRGDHRIRILTKAPVDQSNSFAAQGGVAAVTSDKDSIEQHVADTLMVGGGRSIPSVVRTIISEGPECINELIRMGARFDADDHGLLHLTNEGGHSWPRVVHHLDRTGAEIVRVLLAQVRSLGVEIIPWQRAIDLITVEDHGSMRCQGVRTLDLCTGLMTDRPASMVVLATGGAGQVYRHTTNPLAATGDGVAMALRAGVPVRDMAFVQFHPTALFTGEEGTVHLISEAVRGAGAILRDHHGMPFMRNEHPMADLAPRNVVARAIHRRMLEHGTQHVWLDASSLGVDEFSRKFPAIALVCAKHGISAGRDPIPVMPAAHYLCGGIRTDDRGRTVMEGLLALGECASTGLHGADRLASNSLLEALVVPRRAADMVTIPSAAEDDGTNFNAVLVADDDDLLSLRSRLRGIMTAHLGILRTHDGMVMAWAEIGSILDELENRWGRGCIDKQLVELRDLAAVAWAIADAALREKENVGSHWVDGVVPLKC
jgi:L-aspartate oxidase